MRVDGTVMILVFDEFYIAIVEAIDLDDVLKVYRSNKDFLLHHIGSDSVTFAWLQSEIEAMKASNFYSYKVCDKNTGNIIGIVDFKIGDETYLSLLMVHSNYRSMGMGTRIYQTIEKYVKSHNCTSIKIDVAIDYDNSVLDFWVKRGFTKIQEVTLHWTGKSFPAVMMKKTLSHSAL